MNFDLSTLDRLVTDKKSSESKSTKFAPRAGVRARRKLDGDSREGGTEGAERVAAGGKGASPVLATFAGAAASSPVGGSLATPPAAAVSTAPRPQQGSAQEARPAEPRTGDGAAVPAPSTAPAGTKRPIDALLAAAHAHQHPRRGRSAVAEARSRAGAFGDSSAQPQAGPAASPLPSRQGPEPGSAGIGLADPSTTSPGVRTRRARGGLPAVAQSSPAGAAAASPAPAAAPVGVEAAPGEATPGPHQPRRGRPRKPSAGAPGLTTPAGSDQAPQSPQEAAATPVAGSPEPSPAHLALALRSHVQALAGEELTAEKARTMSLRAVVAWGNVRDRRPRTPARRGPRAAPVRAPWCRR